MNRYLGLGTIMPSYLILPRSLMKLKLTATELWVYLLLLDRARLSFRTPAWRDRKGRSFLYYPIQDLAEALGRSDTAVKTALRQLEEKDLIRRIRQGQGKPNRIYVKLPEAEGWDPDREDGDPLPEAEEPPFRTGGKATPGEQ